MLLGLNRVIVRRIVYASIVATVLGALSVFLYAKICPKILFVSRFPEMWYPRETEALSRKMNSLFEAAKAKYLIEHKHRPWLLVVPHAGYDYSGVVAASGYWSLRGDLSKDVRRVVVLAPSHYVDFYGMSVPNFTHYQTPLGVVEIDVSVVERLKKERFIEHDELVYHREHAIDVQIPFIQMCMPKAKIIPLVIGRMPAEEMVESLATALVELAVDDKTVIVVSSDMVHYGKRFNFSPFEKSKTVERDVHGLESRVIESIKQLSRDDFETVCDETQAPVCGRNVIRIALEVAEKASGFVGARQVSLAEQSEVLLLSHETSFFARGIPDVSAEDYETVGYAALGFFKK